MINLVLRNICLHRQWSKIVPVFFSSLFLVAINTYGQSMLEFSVMPSFVHSDMKWSIAGNLEGKSPNIYSELKFHNVGSFGGISVLQIRPIKYVSVIAKGGFFSTVGGHGSDTDYQKDNRQDPNYVLNFNSSKGDVSNYSFYAVSDLPNGSILDFGITYGRYTQKYYLNSIEHSELNSYYHYKIQTYGIILTKRYNLFKGLSLKNELQLAKLNYKSTANWNLIDRFEHPKSFEHISNGYMFGANSLLSYNLFQKTNLLCSFDYQYERSKKGLDIAYIKNRNKEYTQFNGSIRRIIQFGLGISYKIF